jgi:cytochrome c biogenesis factor
VVGLGIAFSLAYAIMSEGRGWMVGAMIPWAFICGYSIFRYMWRYRAKKLLPMLRAWGPYTAHLGMMLILIGYCLSYGLGTEDSITLQEGERKLAGNFVLELENVTMNSGPPEMACIPKCTAFIRLIENDDDVVIDDQISKRREGNQETTQIYLKHQIHRDLYITLSSVTSEGGENSATIIVREIPGIILVWTGTLFTILGMLMTMFTEWKPGKEWLRSIGK